MTRIIDQINHCSSDSRLSKSTKNMRCHEVPEVQVHRRDHRLQGGQVNRFTQPCITLSRADLHLGQIFLSSCHQAGRRGGLPNFIGVCNRLARVWRGLCEGRRRLRHVKTSLVLPGAKELSQLKNSSNFFWRGGGSESHHSHALRLSLGDTVPDCPPQETKIAPK